MLTRSTRFIGLYAVSAALASLIFGPLLAMSYLATSEGAEDLSVATVAAWAEPASDLAGGLLTFASPDRVYATYTQVLALLFPAIILCALAVRSLRPAPETRLERWGWRLALTGYILFGIGLAALALALIRSSPSEGIVNSIFLSSMIPGLLISLIGSTILGIRLLRSHYRPRLTSWLLALAMPLWVVGMAVLGHNSLGLVPLFIAWAASGSALRRGKDALLHS